MSDMQRLRQQQLFDINIGTPLAGAMGLPDMGGYQHQDPYNIPMMGQGGPTNPTQGQNPNVMPMQLPPVQSGNVNPADSYKSMIDAINQVYTPSTVDRDRNRNLLDNFPTMQQPNGTSRWTAALMGLGARNQQGGGGGDPIGTMDRVLLGPHMRDVEEWKTKAQPFSQASQIENSANVNERNLASNVITQQRMYSDQAERSRIADEKLKTERLRSEAYAFKQMHPGWKFDFSGPTGVAYNPNNPNEKISLGPTGNMSDFDRINLMGENQARVAEIRAGAINDRTEAGGWQIFQQDGRTFEHNRVTGQIRETQLPSGTLVKPGTARPAQDKPITAKEDEAQKQSRWRETFDTNPQWQKWAQPGPSGTIKVAPRPKMGSWTQSDDTDRTDIAEYDRMMQVLYPNYKPPSTAPTQPTTPQSNNMQDANQPGTGPNYRLNKDKSNPNHLRRSFDEGKTWQETFDGGATWR